ncbi:MAG TPA: hypothetical protein VMB50_07825 [Myxococcales bacterium]|nr:hypothetical protein [Myxococcales bacterium]
MATLNPATPAAAPHGGRRHYLIDLQFQLKYTAMIVVFGGVIMGLFGGAVWHEVRTNSELLEGRQIAQTLGAAGGPSLGDFHEAVELTDRRMLWVIVGTSLVVMAGLGLCGVLLSHRVAGPILVLGRYTRVLGEGGFPKIRPLRRGDELQSHFDLFKETVEKMKARAQEEIDQLEAAAGQLAKATGPEATSARETLAALSRRKRDALEERAG